MTIQPAKSRVKELSKMYQDPVLWAWLEMFPPLRGTDSKTTEPPHGAKDNIFNKFLEFLQSDPNHYIR